jgi:sterol desaturase/sphingolipid hydroxylase (fatty acid hydroxylase superfamily)
MNEAVRMFFGAWLLPGWQTIWIVAFWVVLAAFAWLETVSPAFAAEPVRERRWPTNFALGIINMIIAPIAPVSALIGAQWAQNNDWGLLNVLDAPFWLALAATFLSRSFAGYLFHVLMHKVRAFWRLHRVHHSDDRLDVSTTIRTHPLELVALILTMTPLAILLGLDPLVLVAYELAEALISLFSHANLRLPERIDRPLRWVIVTPNMHCIHHSSHLPETDSNYGQVFSFWDRLFGTYSDAPHLGYDAMEIGLGEIRDERTADFWFQIKSPILRSLKK